MARETRRQRRDARRAAGEQGSGGSRASAAHRRGGSRGRAARASTPPGTCPRAARRPAWPLSFIRESWGELKKVEWPNRRTGDPGHGRRHHRLRHRRRLPLRRRPGDSATRQARLPRAVTEGTRAHVPLVRDQHLFRAREQGEGQPRAPDPVDEPAAALPPRRRPDRAGDRDEGRPEGADREAGPARLRARQHGSLRRGLDGRQGHARRDRVRRRRREARAAVRGRGREDPAHRCVARGARRSRRRRWSSSSASRSR